jgi:PAS domain S-box-containing protein
VSGSVLPPSAFLSIVERSSDIVAVVELGGQLKYVNAAIASVLGFKPEELPGAVIYDHVHPEDVGIVYERIAESIGKAEPGKPFVVRIMHANGGWRSLEGIATSMLDDPLIGGVVIQARDITQRSHSEERLRLLETVAVNTRDAVVITQAESVDLPGPRIVYVNRAFLEMTGYGHEEVYGKTLRILEGPRTDRGELDKINNALKRWEPARSELIHYRKDGSEYWVEMDIVPVADDRGWYSHWIAIQRDITERKRAEETIRYMMSGAQCLLWSASVHAKASGEMRWELNIADEEAAQRFLPVDIARGQSFTEAWFRSRLEEDHLRTTQYSNTEVLAGRNYRHEFRCRMSSGSIRWLAEEVYVERISDNHWQCVGVCTDITERKHTEEALRNSEARYQSLVENIPVCVFRKDLEGKLTFGNSQFAAMLGLSQQEFLNKTDFDILPQDIAEKYAQDDQTVIETRTVHEGTEVLRNLSGIERTVRIFKTPVFDSRGEVVGTQGICWDITERALAERAIQQKNALIKLLQEVAFAANQASSLDQAAQMCLELVCRHSGWTLGHLLTPREDEPNILQSSSIWYSSAPERYNEFRLVSEDLTFRTDAPFPGSVAVSQQPLWIPDLASYSGLARADVAANAGLRAAFAFPVVVGTETVGILEFFGRSAAPPDEALMEAAIPIGTQLGRVVERQRARDEIESKARDLARSNSELEQFAYVASHDLQEPLRMVSSYMQLLARRYKGKLDSDADEFIGFAVDGAVRMQALILDLLAFSRVGTRGSAFAPVDMQLVLDKTLANLRLAIAESGAQITQDPLPTLNADSMQIGQLLQNLIGNALKFRGERTPEIHIGATRHGTEWHFTVRDNGIGIDPQYKERIFIIFQRLHRKEEYPGTGIGLAICKKIVERHGGRIWLDSVPGQGATFHFTLPAH